MPAAYYYNEDTEQWVLIGAVNRAVFPYGGGLEDLSQHGNSGSSETIDLSDGNVHTITLDDNCVLSFTGATNGFACSFTLIVTQDSGGGNTITWPGSVVWNGGTEPTLTSTGDAVDVFTFLTTDNGASWLGFTAAQDMS